MTTIARPNSHREAGWYTLTGQPLYDIPKASGGTRSPTLADAKKRGDLLPRVSTILNLLDKPALNDWKVEQGVLAVMTTTQKPGEVLDDFIYRVLHIERVQDQERDAAADRGTQLHRALQSSLSAEAVAPELLPWIEPVAKAVLKRGKVTATEKVLVGEGYAGRTDLIQETPDCWWILDFKTTKKLPEKGSWFEHVLQLSAYAAAYANLLPSDPRPIRTANVYVSTLEAGKFVIWENPLDWREPYRQAFAPLVSVWQFQNNYRPKQ